MNLGFVFTNYNNSNHTLAVIQSIEEVLSNKCNYVIIIVDNNSNQIEVANLNTFKNVFKNVVILFEKNNTGYFNGLNIGLKYLNNFYPDFKHVVIGNNDIKLNPLFYNQFEDSIYLFDNYPVVSPNIITPDGKHQNPHVIKNISKFREYIYYLFYSNYFISKIILLISNFTKKISDRKDELSFDKEGEIYQGHGSCYILGPLFFQNFDKLFSPSFLMFEEFFLTYQLHTKSYKVFYTPNILIYHYGHSTIQHIPSKFIWDISRQSYKTYRQYLKLYKNS
jgi:GT2 family glycosyltransferase